MFYCIKLYYFLGKSVAAVLDKTVKRVIFLWAAFVLKGSSTWVNWYWPQILGTVLFDVEWPAVGPIYVTQWRFSLPSHRTRHLLFLMVCSSWKELGSKQSFEDVNWGVRLKSRLNFFSRKKTSFTYNYNSEKKSYKLYIAVSYHFLLYFNNYIIE